MHFSVLVISKTGTTKEVEGLLEPFFEHDILNLMIELKKLKKNGINVMRRINLIIV